MSAIIVDQQRDETRPDVRLTTDGVVSVSGNSASFTINIKSSSNSITNDDHCSIGFSIKLTCKDAKRKIVWQSSELKDFKLTTEIPALELFTIKQGELQGFNSALTPGEIESRIGDSLVIPNNVVSISNGAFYRYGESTIPSKVVKLIANSSNSVLLKIGDGAFRGAPFKTVSISKSVQNIGSGAFAECSNLNEIDIGDIFEIPRGWNQGCFDDCASIGSIEIFGDWYIEAAKNWFNKPAWNVTARESIFEYDAMNPGIIKGFNSKLTQDEINVAFTYIGETLVIPEGVTEIVDHAFFNGASSTIPTTVKKLEFKDNQCSNIGGHAFRKAPFTTIEFPSWETDHVYVGDYAFAEMPNITKIDASSWNGRICIPSDSFFSGVQTKTDGIITVKEDQGSISTPGTAGHWFANAGFGNHAGGLLTNWLVREDIPVINEVFKINGTVLKGFSDEFIACTSPKARKNAIRKISGNESLLLIPKLIDFFYVEQISSGAFLDLPDFITEIAFDENSICHTIGSVSDQPTVFSSNTVTKMRIPSSVSTIYPCSFQLPALSYIDFSAKQNIQFGTNMWAPSMFEEREHHAPKGTILVKGAADAGVIKKDLQNFVWNDATDWKIDTVNKTYNVSLTYETKVDGITINRNTAETGSNLEATLYAPDNKHGIQLNSVLINNVDVTENCSFINNVLTIDESFITGDIVIDAQKVSILENIFTFTMGSLSGFSSEFLSASPAIQKASLRAITGDETTLKIPQSQGRQSITSIWIGAFCNDSKDDNTRLPSFITTIDFTDSAITTIGTRLIGSAAAFGNSSKINRIIISSSIRTIYPNSFINLQNLSVIDFSALTTNPTWSTATRPNNAWSVNMFDGNHADTGIVYARNSSIANNIKDNIKNFDYTKWLFDYPI